MSPELATVLRLETDVAARKLRREVALETARRQLGLSETRYFQLLLSALDDQEAWAAFPVLVHRLERFRQRSRDRRWRPQGS